MLKKYIVVSSIIAMYGTTAFGAAPYNPVTAVKDGGSDVVANPSYKVGETYKVLDIEYKPNVDYDYEAVGIASWYGKEFQGGLTANGEVFDMNQVTAAHPTLPMPSFIEITNLDNGKKIVARVNDRGPFESGRVIDLSMRAAELLGYKDVGTARVKVKVLSDVSKEVAENLMKAQDAKYKAAGIGASEPEVVATKAQSDSKIESPEDDNSVIKSVAVSLNESPKAINVDDSPSAGGRPVALVEPDRSIIKSYSPRGVFVQVGAFSEDKSISKAMGELKDIGVITFQDMKVAGDHLTRVRMGPYANINDANSIRKKISSMGYTSSRVVIEQ